jgi:hypothetical protein
MRLPNLLWSLLAVALVPACSLVNDEGISDYKYAKAHCSACEDDDDEGDDCTFESGPCEVTMTCRGAEGGSAWDDSSSTCDVEPIPCTAKFDQLNNRYGKLTTPINDGDRCPYAGGGCFYLVDDCKGSRMCQLDHTWGAESVDCFQ